MATRPSESELNSIRSPFHKLIATSYTDGPVEGFVRHREWPEACVFQLVAKDPASGLRVFEVGRMPGVSFEWVVGELFDHRLPTWPVWVLPPRARPRADELVGIYFRHARLAVTLTGEDPCGRLARLVLEAPRQVARPLGLVRRRSLAAAGA